MLLQNMQKFITPLYHFLPPFFAVNIGILHAQIRFSMNLLCKKGSKKRVRGVKNFCIFWSNISAFICTKNHCHILKTHENIYSGGICSHPSKSGKKKVLPLKYEPIEKIFCLYLLQMFLIKLKEELCFFPDLE